MVQMTKMAEILFNAPDEKSAGASEDISSGSSLDGRGADVPGLLNELSTSSVVISAEDLVDFDGTGDDVDDDVG